MNQKKLTKKRVAELYRFLSDAKMSRLEDNERIDIIKLLRSMKPIGTEVLDALNEAINKAKDIYPDNTERVADIVNKSMEDLWMQKACINIRVLSRETIDRLALSNDWTFSLIDEMENEFCNEQNKKES